MRSSPTSRIVSSEAPGCECESASRAAASLSRRRRDTVTWSRLSSAVLGSTTVLGGAGEDAGERTPTGTAELASRRFSRKPLEGVITSAVEVDGLGAGAAHATGTAVTTVRTGGAGSGRSSAVTSFASDFDRWKNRGRTSSKFDAVTTLDSSATVVKQSRPSRIGSSTCGNCWMSSAARFRKKAAPFESPSSRVRNANSEL
jgi:hypothetical protein